MYGLWISIGVDEMKKRFLGHILLLFFLIVCILAMMSESKGQRYYGRYSECEVYFEENVLPVRTEFEVAGELFCCSRGFNIRVSYRGEVCNIDEAYEKGWLSKTDVAEIAKVHREFWE